jgi:hypothetical protein
MNYKKETKLILAAIGVLLLVTNNALAAPPPGVTTTPYTVSYSARLTDAAGAAVTTARDIRFSLWSDADFDATDLLPAGTINPAAGGFTGWQETHTVTPDSSGLFHVRLGSITTLPNFTASTHVFLQVDVKATGLPDTSYECLDPDGNTANLTDRFPLDSAAFTINADTVDNADVGTAAGNIPSLDLAGLLPISTIPGATNSDTFILDNNDTIPPGGPGSVILQFGNTLNKILEYDTAATWFNFNDDVNITGNLTTTGTINGVTVGPYNQSISLEPLYRDSVLQQDGANNRGKMENFFIDTDGVPGNNNINYYVWTTQQAAMQDMDIVIRVLIPDGFVSWQVTPIQFTYRTQDGVLANNMVDFSLEDTAGNPVVLAGATSLVSPVFTTTNITFGGAPVFTPGQAITIKIKLSATSVGAAYAGKIILNYNGR